MKASESWGFMDRLSASICEVLRASVKAVMTAGVYSKGF